MSSVSRLVFVDYDGTLLTKRHDLSLATKTALDAAHRAGIVVVPASSRPLVGLDAFGGPHLEMAVALNGAVVRRTFDHMWEAPAMPAPDVEICMCAASSRELCLNVYTATHWLTTEPADPRVAEEERRIRARPTLLQAVPPGGIHKVLILGDPRDLDGCEDDLRRAMRDTATLHWFRSEPSYLEIARAATSKATGVRLVRRWVAAARTYAIGDALSDLPMFRSVDVAIAVGNASPAVREAAAVVVAANDDDGVALALEQIRGGTL